MICVDKNMDTIQLSIQTQEINTWKIWYDICDMIKRNESDVGDIGIEILAKTVFQFLCFILFLALTNPS